MEQRLIPELAEAVRFQRDLYLYWREVQTANGLPLTTRGYLTRPALRRVVALLGKIDGLHEPVEEQPEIEQERCFFLRRLLQRLRLLQAAPDTNKLVAAPAEEMARYLAHSLAERLHICTRLWVAGGWWLDHPDSHTALPRMLTPAPPRIALARRRLLDQLAHSRIIHAARDMASANAPQQDILSATKAPHMRGAVRRKVAALSTNEDDIREAALSGPLLWMGLVLPSGETHSPAQHHALFGPYRPTPATFALQQPEADANAETLEDTLLETPGRVVAQSNFEVIAFPPLTAPLLWFLDNCTENIALDQAARYRLTQQAFAGARRQQWNAERLAARLEALTITLLPQNVRMTLGDWERQVERVRLTRQTTLLEVPDAALLDALLADSAMKGVVERRLTATAVLLAADAGVRVRAWLLRHGELPATTAL